MSEPQVDPDLDPVSGVFRNRLGIADAEALRAAEADISAARLYLLTKDTLPVPMTWLTYDVSTIGSSGTSTRGQGRSGWCPSRGLPRPALLDRLTHYFAEVNAIHPFREGNGRAQRAFFGQLSREAGWAIDWSALDPEENVAASKASLRGDNRPLRDFLDSLLAG